MYKKADVANVNHFPSLPSDGGRPAILKASMSSYNYYNLVLNCLFVLF